jgi:hypothetical protein
VWFGVRRRFDEVRPGEWRRRRSDRVVALAAAFVVALSLGAGNLCAVAPARTAASAARVTVSISRTGIVFAPAAVPMGVVVFKVFNRTAAARDFGVGGTRTRAITAGRSATLTVALSGRESRVFSSLAGGGRERLTGVLDVFEPCTTPTRTTVQVQMAQGMGGIAVSQSSVSCGSVTFVITDTGTLSDSLQVFSERPAPWVAGQTPELQPGQTAKLTLRFAAKGLVHLESGDYPLSEPENGFSEVGKLTLV